MKKINLNELGKSLNRGEMRHVNGGGTRNSCEQTCISMLDCGGLCNICSASISYPNEQRCRMGTQLGDK